MGDEPTGVDTQFISDFSEEIWYQTYKYHTDNNVSDTHWRVAKDLASAEVESEKWGKLFYEALSGFKVVPGGRISSNAGTNLHGATYINCFVDGPVVNDKDSVEGIFNALTRAALTLKSEGGYGFCSDFIRPRGAFIHGVGVETPGAVEMLRLWDQMSDVITKGSGKKKTHKEGKNKIRKGAMMVTMSCWHPDILEFITAKQTEGVLSKFNMSVLCTDEFMDAVENHKPWRFVYPDTTFEHYKEEWDGNLGAWEAKGYPVIVYGELSDANELWDLIMDSTYARNEPGVLFVDRMNQLNNLKYVEHISATNPCVAKGTLVNTPKGYRKVEDICVGDSISTVRGSEKVETIETHSNLDIFKVRFADGGEELVTAAHRYHAIRAGTNHKKYQDIRLDELNVGDSVRVAPTELDVGNEYDYIDGLKIGILLGDGCYAPNTLARNNVKIASSTDDAEYNNNVKSLFGGQEQFRQDDLSTNSKSMNMCFRSNSIIEKLGLSPALAHEKHFDICRVISENMAMGILDGLIATDGNINLKTNHPQVRIMTSSAELAQLIRRLFLVIGCHAKINVSFKDDGGVIDGRKIVRRHPKHTIIVNSSSLIPLVKKSRLAQIHPEKGGRLAEAGDLWALTGGNWRTKIVSIEPAGKADVYDLYCSGSDTWITSGYVQRGCGEQILPVGGVCLLGSINLTQFVNVKKNDWDYDKLANYITIFVRMLDNVNDRTLVPLAEQRWNLQNKRRIGIGYLGYGSALYLMRVRYGSKKALNLTDKLAKFVTNECYKASALLAKEKGAFPLYDEEEYLSSNFIAQALEPETVALIKEHGVRNSHLTSIQPTGNSSVYANNVSGGLEPVVSAEYVRTVVVPVAPNGLFVPRVNWDARTFEADGDTAWDWVKEGDESILLTRFNDEVYKFDRNRGLTKENLVEDYAVHLLKEESKWEEEAGWAANIFNLTIKEHVETMKVFAKYIDSAMSKTINLPNDYPYEDFKGLYLDMYKSNVIKGGTTYREGTMTNVISTSSTSEAQQEKEGIVYNAAPKRPDELECDVHHLTVGGERWVVFIGLFDGLPYEAFAGLMENVHLGKKVVHGRIIKHSRNKYGFANEDVEVKDINAAFNNATQSAITRLVSMSLRHGVDIKFIVSQLQKTGNGLNTFAKCLARTLKKYIKEGEDMPDLACDQCGAKTIIMMEGCNKCLTCGASACA